MHTQSKKVSLLNFLETGDLQVRDERESYPCRVTSIFASEESNMELRQPKYFIIFMYYIITMLLFALKKPAL